MRWPWWLNPWKAIREYRETRLVDLDTIGRLAEENRTANEKVAALERRNAGLARQIRVHTGAVDSDGRSTGRAVAGWEQQGGAAPEFAMIGMDRGAAGGKRLYVSRDLGGASFGIEGASPTWNLRTSMANMLVIDKPTYGAAMEQMAAIWRNWDAEAASAHRPQAKTPAIEMGKDSHDG